jgi:carbamate kinase
VSRRSRRCSTTGASFCARWRHPGDVHRRGGGAASPGRRRGRDRQDLASALLAIDLHADALLIVTDVDAVYADYGTPSQRAIRRATPTALAGSAFAAGSMGPKVHRLLVRRTDGRPRRNRPITGAAALLSGDAGTVVTLDAQGLELIHSV